MISAPSSFGNNTWDQVNARARKVDRRRDRRHRRNDQSAATNLRLDRRRDKRFSFTVVNSGLLSFLFEEVHDLVQTTLNSRKKINGKRRKSARTVLLNANELRVIRHNSQGATIVIKSRKHGDFYIPVREADCDVIDTWGWMTKLEARQLEIGIELLDIYGQLSHKKLKRLFKIGGVTIHSTTAGAILVQLNKIEMTYITELLEEAPEVESIPLLASTEPAPPTYQDVIEEWVQAA
jgi:hypothetical protein